MKVYTNLNCSKHFLIFASAVTGCFSISTFAFLACIPTRTTSSALGLKNCAITAAIIKKKKKKDHKLVSLAKTILYSIEVLTSKSLCCNPDEFIGIFTIIIETLKKPKNKSVTVLNYKKAFISRQ